MEEHWNRDMESCQSLRMNMTRYVSYLHYVHEAEHYLSLGAFSIIDVHVQLQYVHMSGGTGASFDKQLHRRMLDQLAKSNIRSIPGKVSEEASPDCRVRYARLRSFYRL